MVMSIQTLLIPKERVLAPLNNPNGIPHTQVEYKLRRFVNDYLQPPKSPKKHENWFRKIH